MKVLAEQAFDLADPDQKVWARIYEPFLKPDGETWACHIDIDEPVGGGHLVYGTTSLQALLDALRRLTMHLYTSDVWKDKKLGVRDVYGGDLWFPAMQYPGAIVFYPF